MTLPLLPNSLTDGRLTLLGVLGGVIAFGFVGMFIGPVLLAVGDSLMSEWTGTEDPIVKHDEDIAPG